MSDKRHFMLSIGLFITVLVLGGVGLVLPNAREVHDIRDRIADLQSRSEGVEQTTAMVEQLSIMMTDAKQSIDAELKIIPEQSGVTAMIRELSLSIDSVRVLDQTFTVGSTIDPLPETHPSIRAVPVTMEMESTFDSIYAVLRAVESMDRLVRLRSMRIRAMGQQTNPQGDPIVETVLAIDAVYEDGP